MRNPLYQLLFWLHLLSLDVALGACALLYAVSKVLSLEISWPWFFLLFHGTLLIYWLDHLIDTKQHLLVRKTSRHGIFFHHKKVFQFGLILLFVACGFVTLNYVGIREILLGISLLAGMITYLFFHRLLFRWGFEKEFLIGFLYSSSILFAPFIQLARTGFLMNQIAVIFLLIFATVLQNLFSIATMDASSDQEYGIKNVSNNLGQQRVRTIQIVLLIIQGLLTFFLWITHPWNNYILFVILLLVLSSFEFLIPVFFRNPKSEAFRMAGEWGFVFMFFL